MRSLLVLALMSGCIEPARFTCADDAQCGPGRCEPAGYCSFDDTGCESGRRFGAAAGDLASTCVEAAPPDAPPDAGMLADAAVDAAVDAAPACPAGYVSLSPANGHFYRLVGNPAGWTNQRALCGNEPANVYLAVPDDDAELAALVALASADIWVGLSDAADEGMFVTVRGLPATFSPWAPDEPDNDGNQDCVLAEAATGRLATSVCGAPVAAVCECEP